MPLLSPCRRMNTKTTYTTTYKEIKNKKVTKVTLISLFLLVTFLFRFYKLLTYIRQIYL